VIASPPAKVYAAFVDAAALEQWLPPRGMSAEFERFDPRPGGSYRLVLTYLDSAGSPGKATADSDVVEARFVELSPDRRVVQEVEFESDEPSFAGTMTMTWEVTVVEGGARVEFVAEDVPEGISAADHATGLAASLENLARYLQQ
jgi:uncharacterized protein YndB with AHSA1/START domain